MERTPSENEEWDANSSSSEELIPAMSASLPSDPLWADLGCLGESRHEPSDDGLSPVTRG